MVLRSEVRNLRWEGEKPAGHPWPCPPLLRAQNAAPRATVPDTVCLCGFPCHTFHHPCTWALVLTFHGSHVSCVTRDCLIIKSNDVQELLTSRGVPSCVLLDSSCLPECTVSCFPPALLTSLGPPPQGSLGAALGGLSFLELLSWGHSFTAYGCDDSFPIVASSPTFCPWGFSAASLGMDR